MALTVLLEARPMRAADAVPVVVRLAGLGSRAYTHAGANDWWAGITDAPRFSTALAFGQSGWTGGAVPTTGAIGFAPSDRARIDALAALVWEDAAVTIWTGDDAAADPVWTVALDGVIAGIATRDGVLTLTVADLSKKLARPIAADRFTGKGGIEGGSDAAERLKRRSFGRCWGVEARLLDKASNVYEVGDPARPLASIDAVKDRGRAASAITVIAWAGSIAATLDALKAAAVPQGGAAVAPSIACVKWWTQPSGPLTVDLRGEVGAGYVETVAEIAARIADGAGLPTLNVAAAVAIRPDAAGLHVDSDSETAAQALDRLLLRASLLWLLEPEGAIRLLPIGFDAAGPVVDALDASREASYKPVTRVVLGYQRNHRPHNAGEISAVFQASDGTYADGTPIEELKPATPRADVTSANTAAAIFGQGALATQSLLANGGPFLSGFGQLSERNHIKIGSQSAIGFDSWPLLTSGGTGTTDATVLTALGVASGIFGQGALATLSMLANGGPFLSGFGQLSARSYIKIGSQSSIGSDSWPLLTSGGTGTTDGTVLTALGVASAIFGQGALATQGTVRYADQIGGLPAAIGAGAFFDGGRLLYASRVVYDDAGVVSAYRPEEAGSNRTETRVASAITGQGWAATQGEAATSNARVPVGANAVADSGFARGMALFDAAGGVLGLNLGGYWGRRSVGYIHRPGAFPAGDTMDVAQLGRWGERGSNENMRRYLLPVRQGDRVGVRTLAAHHRAQATLFLLLFDKDGVFIFGQSTGVGSYDGGAAGGEAMGEMSIILDISLANAAYAGWMLRGDGLAGGSTDPFIFFAEPWLGKLAPGQTVLPPYSVGPADVMGDRTLDNTAAGIAGQGALATRSSVAYGDGYVFGFGPLATRHHIKIGNQSAIGSDSWPLLTSGGTGTTDATVLTALGVASAIFGQGALATQGTVRYADQIGGLPAAIGAGAFFDGGRLLYASRVVYDDAGVVSAYRPEEAGSNRTETRVASAITGQSAWATFGASTSVVQKLGSDGNLPAGGVYYPGVAFLNDRWPEEAGGNRTETRVASAITGQSAWATYGNLTPATVAGQVSRLDGNGNLPAQSVHLPGVAWLSDRWPQEAGANVTEFRTAAALTGQGALATTNAISDDSQLAGNMATRLTPFASDPRFLRAGHIAWDGGDTVQNWKPGEAGANRTESRTAAAVAGQGALATQNGVAYGNQIYNLPAGISPPNIRADGYFDGFFTKYYSGRTLVSVEPQEAGSNVTEGRTAAAIVGQGALATTNAISDDSQLAGNMATRLTPFASDPRFLRAGHIAWDGGDTVQNWKPGEAGANRTEGRTAAGIAGQSYLATNYPERLGPSPQQGAGYLAASAVAFSAGETTESLRPGEAGSNRTEGRTAAAIAGQGAFATAPQIGSWNVASYYNFSAFSLNYSITRSDGVSIVTEALSITQYGVAAAFAGQGALATKSQAGAGDLAPGAAQRIAYSVLQQTISCGVGN